LRATGDRGSLGKRHKAARGMAEDIFRSTVSNAGDHASKLSFPRSTGGDGLAKCDPVTISPVIPSRRNRRKSDASALRG